MKTQISRWSDDPAKRRSGIYQQQGRMISDADLNELVELLKRRVDDALGDIVGSGTPRAGGVGLVSAGTVAAAGPLLRPGALYADGVRARLTPATPGLASFALNAQADFPSPPAWTNPGDQILYADLWELTTTALQDPAQLDPGLHGADTSTRTQMLAQVKWCPAATDPLTSPQNPRKGDATLAVELREGQAEADPCDPCAAEIALDARIGNYLFRVEVHDVKGPANAPTEITLKWSSENGAEQHAQADVPAEFKRGDWIYEFYNDTTERHPGVHLVAGFAPARAVLEDGWPAAADLPAPAQYPYARRWDGYAILVPGSGTTWTVKSISGTLQAKDRGRVFIPLPSGATPTHGHFTAGASLVAYLGGLKLTLDVAAKKFVAGDFWLATVREDAEGAARVQQSQATPVGIEHHYVVLARANGAALVPAAAPFTDADTRRLSFPRLTDLTADHVGYDPALKAARWNDILESSDPVLQPRNVQSALDALIENLESTDVSYAVPACPTTPSVRSLFGTALTSITNAQGKVKLDELLSIFLCSFVAGTVPFTNLCTRLFGTADNVQQALNELCNMDGADIAYPVPSCAGSTVQALMTAAFPNWDVDGDGRTSIKDVLDSLLCRLTAAHIPFNHTCGSGLYPSGMPANVAAALNALCNIKAEHIGYVNGSFANVKQALDSLVLLATNIAVPPGTVMAFAAPAAPAGWLECNGFARSRTTFSALFGAIGTRYGIGDGSTTFNVPELRGEFIRGWNNARSPSADPGRVFGVFQADQFQNHQHLTDTHQHAGITDNSLNIRFGGFDLFGTGGVQANSVGGTGTVNHNHSFTTDSRGVTVRDPSTGNHGAETRPRNVALMYCIKH